MTATTAIERLRELLDELGVKHVGNGDMTRWTNESGCVCRAYSRPGHLTVDVAIMDASPEQAIAATLGRRTCRLHDCGGSFSAVNRPVWRCDCGAFMTQYTDATTYHKPRFCPNCGRRVEVDE